MTKWVNWLKIGTNWVNWSKMGQMGQIRSFVANHVMSRSRAFFWHFLLKIDVILSNIRHYLCNFRRHYLFNFQITGLLLWFLKLRTVWVCHGGQQLCSPQLQQEPSYFCLPTLHNRRWLHQMLKDVKFLLKFIMRSPLGCHKEDNHCKRNEHRNHSSDGAGVTTTLSKNCYHVSV